MLTKTAPTPPIPTSPTFSNLSSDKPATFIPVTSVTQRASIVSMICDVTHSQQPTPPTTQPTRTNLQPLYL